VLTHKLLGFPIFLAILWIMFQVTFSLGAFPGELIEIFFEKLGELATLILPHGFIQSLAVDGIIAGVGGVLVFLPNILILFFFISLLEDTGYMARSAFIMDRIMHFFGLHGKSFLPMLVGFGCTVPAIMATRTLENRRDRLITMFVVPFMSCGARMPVYILLAGAFFSPRNAGNVIFSIYLIGILLSLIVAKICSFAHGPSTPFVMELPPYRIPTMRSILLHIWERTILYVKKAGTIILVASIIMWFLMTYPKTPGPDNTLNNRARTINAVTIEHTYAGRFGKIIEPVFKPLGLDWRVGVALIAGFAAKEVVVSTLATIYSVGGEDENVKRSHLIEALRNDPKMNPVSAYGLMLFVLIYVPCLAVLSILKREAGGWKWVGIMVLYTTSLAWLVSFAFIKTVHLLM
ncbi:MAG: ferrous iron transport protein B, partial [Candidatus Latescibacteria bacterium]|nr:ferrous iron transport protein B [Candidatus Latescibacterota bacterium]